MNKGIRFFLLLVLVGVVLIIIQNNRTTTPSNPVVSFDSCVEAGYPVAESYPRQCRDGEDVVYTENIGNGLEKTDLVRIASVLPNQIITSPLLIEGEARGFWYFEADFPVRLIDANGNDVPLDLPYISADGEWMTEEFVPFSGTHTFIAPATDTGTLILMKDNPSGLPENEDQLTIPVRFR